MEKRYVEIYQSAEVKLRKPSGVAIYSGFRPHHKLGTVVVLLADVFEQLRTRGPLHRKTCGPGFCVSTGIIDCDFILKGREVDPSQSFDQMKPVRMRQRVAVHPHTLVEADRINHERIAFPMTDGMSVIARRQVRRMWSSVHVDSVESMRPANIHNEDALLFRHVEDFKAVCSCPQTRARRRFAPRIRFVAQEVGMTIINHRASPILQWNIVDMDWSVQSRAWFVAARVYCQSSAATPQTFFTNRRIKIHSASGQRAQAELAGLR